ncbi:MAG: hypothetical protein ACJ72D_25780 [Marmoricola sp.]
MRNRTTDSVITAALGHLDPAPETDLSDVERSRAGAAFARIVATPGGEPVPARPRRFRRRLLVTTGLTVAAAAVGSALLGGGTAFGSWTPEPRPLAPQVAASAATTCRTALGVPNRGEQIAVAERRGGWTYVLLAGPRTEVVCLMPQDLVGQDHPDRGLFFGSYDTDAAAPPVLAPDAVDETTSTEGTTDEGWFVATEGYVGSDVSGVTVHTSSGLDVEASVVGNRFAAWWPASRQSSHHSAETWTYTVHLADGGTGR